MKLVEQQSFSLLLLTDSIEIYNSIRNCLENKYNLQNKYQLTWLANYNQWQTYYLSRQYNLYLVDRFFFSLLQTTQSLNDAPLILITDSNDAGIKALEEGVIDYWNLNDLDEYSIERSLRLIFHGSQQFISLNSTPTFYKDFFSHFVDGLFSLNVLSDGTLVYNAVNLACEKLIGVPKTDIIGRKITDLLPALEERKYQDCLSSQKVIKYEHRVKRNNEVLTWSIVLVPLKNQQEEVFQILGSARNITSEKENITQQIKLTRYRNFQRSIALKIRESLNIKDIMTTTVTQLRKIIDADRVVILEFLADGSGKIIEEAIRAELPSMLGQIISGQYYKSLDPQGNEAESFYAWKDIEVADISESYRQFLRQYKVRASLLIPIIRYSTLHLSYNSEVKSIPRLWGLLSVHQCHNTHLWKQDEIELLQELVEQLNIAISQAKLLEKEVKQRQELARSNEELEQFAYIASHDLQAPLQTISSYAQLIEYRYKERLDDKADKYINYIVEGVHRMKTQIDDLLEYSRVNRQQNTFRETDFSKVVQQAIANLHSEIELTQAQVTYSNKLPTLIVDRSQFVTLMQNLIGNSLKYRRQPPIIPQIVVDAVATEDSWQFAIEDNGIGIEEEHQQRIFQIFQRLHTQDEYPGTGIGLAICQRIVQRHGGKIWVKSQMDRGTTFYFSIPRQNYYK